MLQELLEVGAGVFGLELNHGVQQLGEVLHARLVLNVLGCAKSRQVAGLLQDRLQAGCGRFGAGNLRQIVHESDELAVLLHSGGTQARNIGSLASGGKERDAVGRCVISHHRLGLGTDTTLGLVQDAAHVHVVIGVAQGTQVGERILDFLTLVEASATDHAVGQAGTHKHVLEGSGLRVGAVEDGDIAGLHAVLVRQAINFAGDEASLGMLGFGNVTDNLRARTGGGPQLLGATVGTCVAKEMAENSKRIEVINSGTLCGPQKYLVDLAVKLVELGKNKDEIVNEINKAKEETKSFLIPNDFDYLVRGGRLSSIVGKIGSVIKLVPVMTLSEDKKSLVKFTTKRTFKRALQKISEDMINKGINSNYKIYISHACNEELAKSAENIILENIENADIETNLLGPVFTTQGGPGCISIQYIRKHEVLK